MSNETGIALSAHPPLDAVENVREVVRVMLDEGMNPEKAVIAHSDLFFVPRDLRILITDPESWRLNTDLARELLGRGFNISIDSFGHFQDGEPVGILLGTAIFGICTSAWTICFIFTVAALIFVPRDIKNLRGELRSRVSA